MNTGEKIAFPENHPIVARENAEVKSIFQKFIRKYFAFVGRSVRLDFNKKGIREKPLFGSRIHAGAPCVLVYYNIHNYLFQVLYYKKK